MNITIHQPVFYPYLGFFRKLLLSDIFVIYDTAQYSKNNWHNRNRIKTAKGATWLTVPVAHHLGDNFNQAMVSGQEFVEGHLGLLQTAYNKAPFFNEIFPLVKETYKSPFKSLGEFNERGIRLVVKLLELPCRIEYASTFALSDFRATEALVAITKKVGGRTYIAGLDSDYMDLSLFEKADIAVMKNDFTAKPHLQQGVGEFIPNLSVLDALFNLGPAQTKKLIS